MILMPGMMSDYSWDMGKFWSAIPQWPTFICSLVVCDNLVIVVPFKSNPKVSTIFWQFQKEGVDYPGGGDWGSNTTFELYVQLFKVEV